MNKHGIDDLIRRWHADAPFRAAMQVDPMRAARGAGFALSESEWQALVAMDWNVTDEQLGSRISAMIIC